MFSNSLNHPEYFAYINEVNRKTHHAKIRASFEKISKSIFLHGRNDSKTNQAINRVYPTLLSQNQKWIQNDIENLQEISAKYINSRPLDTTVQIPTHYKRMQEIESIVLDDLELFKKKWKLGRVIMHTSPMNDFSEVKSIPSPRSVDPYLDCERSRASLNSSCVYEILQSTCQFTNREASTCMMDKIHTWHVQQPCYNVNITGGMVNAAPIPIIDSIHQTVNPLSNFVEYPNNQQSIAQLWTGNLHTPPSHNLRTVPIYRAAFGNFEVLPSTQIIAARLGNQRYVDNVTHLCQFQYMWPDGGIAYLRHLEGLHCLLPGNWLHKKYVCSQAHHHNYQVMKLNSSPNHVVEDRSWQTIQHRPINNPNNQRRNEMLMNLAHQRTDQENDVNAPDFGYSEEGKRYC